MMNFDVLDAEVRDELIAACDSESQARVLFAKLLKAGADEGIAKERGRVCAHLELGESSGDIGLAAEMIRSGAAVDDAARERYMYAALRRKPNRGLTLVDCETSEPGQDDRVGDGGQVA